MEIFGHVTEVVFVLLGIAFIATVIKYPKQVFIDLPAGIFKMTSDRLLSYIQFLTAPIWLPFWFLDQQFEWKFFEHKFFKIFNHFDSLEDDQPDIEYIAHSKKAIKLHEFETYLISSHKDVKKIEESIIDGIESLNNKAGELKIYGYKDFNIIEFNEIQLYDFIYLVQWLDAELPKSKNYCFAKTSGFSFFGLNDESTVNNIVGKTSDKRLFAYNLTNGLIEYLTLNKDIKIKTRLTPSFFKKLIEKKVPID